jgi:type IV pilus assembly protein PilW
MMAGGVQRRRQRGVTLVELMVSIAIGLLTIAVALGALMVSRGVSSTVSDAAQLQQQAAYALRIIGQQVRQAGATQLNLAAGKDSAEDALADDPVSYLKTGYTRIGDVISGTDTTLTVGYSNYVEQNTSNVGTMFRSCLGGHGDPTADQLITSAFRLDGDELKCNDNLGEGAQALIKNVTALRVWYLVQQPGNGTPATFRATADEVSNWANVTAVEVCLELRGNELIDVPSTAWYTNCQGGRASFDGRLRMVFRDTFQIRSQGLYQGP